MEIQGYGINLNAIVFKRETEEELIRFEQEFLSFLSETKMDRAWNEWYKNHSYESSDIIWKINKFGTDFLCNPAEIFADILREKTGIFFTGEQDRYGVCYILYKPGYPWHMNKQEFKLSGVQDIRKILEHYLSPLSSRQRISNSCGFYQIMR